MNIPNILTVFRFILIPVFAHYLYVQKYQTAVIVFLIAGLTDVLDGHIARKFNLITSWGKFADPLADKLMQVTAVALLTMQKKIPWFILAIVIVKESLMGIGGYIIYKTKKFVVSANWYGKMATVIFYFAIALIIIFDFSALINNILIGIAVISTLFALFMYSQSFVKLKNTNF